MARASRVEKGRSSSTIRRLWSPAAAAASGRTCTSAMMRSPRASCDAPFMRCRLFKALYRNGFLLWEGLGRRSFHGRLDVPLEGGAGPCDPDRRPRCRRDEVREGELRARALDQSLGDEQPEPQA